jgi:competence transcription factor ComK
MSKAKDIKYVIHKRMVYVIKVGPLYLWKTASATKSECILKALEVFKVKTENALKYKGAEIIRLFVKEIRTQEDSSGNI